MAVKFIDNSAQFLADLEIQRKAGLEACGNQAVSHSKSIITSAGRIATGNMHDHVDHKVQDEVCYVGTNTRYAIYNEMGTGIYIAGGRKTPWHYKDAEGEWHTTKGMPPIHFIKNSLANFIAEYKAIFIKHLRGG